MTIFTKTHLLHDMMNVRSNVWDESILCSQCMSTYPSRKTKPICEENGVICGRICDYCRMSNVENARKCQLKRCVSSDRVQSLRTLPAKFYDLASGQSKIDIITQFGIHKDTKACCNTCYLRISRAAQKAKIFTADVAPSELSTSEYSNDSYSNSKESIDDQKDVCESEIAADTGYTGPQFRRKEGLIPFWLKHKVKDGTIKQPKEITNPTKQLIEKESGITDTEEDFLYDIEGHDSDVFDSSKDDNYIPPSEYSIKPSRSPPKTRSRAVKKPSRYAEDVSDFIIIEEDEIPLPENIPKMNDNTLADSSSGEVQREIPIKQGATLTPITSALIPVTSALIPVTSVSISVTSALIPVTSASIPVVSTRPNFCLTCHKEYVSSNTPAKPNDEGYECESCNSKMYSVNKTSNQTRRCPVRGCTTPVNELHVGILPAGYFSLSRAHKKTLMMKYGLAKNGKTCCKNCFPKIKASVKECSDMRDITYTMCQICEHVVPEHSTTPGLDDAGNPVVKCYSCCKGIENSNTSPPTRDNRASYSKERLRKGALKKPTTSRTSVETVNPSAKMVAKSVADGHVELPICLANFNQTKHSISGALASVKPNNVSKLFNFCAIKGCVSSGHCAWLYPLDDILRHCSKPLLKEAEDLFGLTESSNQHGCWSCFNQVKWFVASKTNAITEHIQSHNVPILPRPTTTPVSFTTSISTLLSTCSTTPDHPSESNAILFPLVNKMTPVTDMQHPSTTCVNMTPVTCMNIYPKYPVVGSVFSLTSAQPSLIQSISNTMQSALGTNHVINTIQNPTMLTLPEQTNRSLLVVPKPHQDGPKLVEVVASRGQRLNPIYLPTFDKIQIPAPGLQQCVRRIQPKPIQPRPVTNSKTGSDGNVVASTKTFIPKSNEANFTQQKWKLDAINSKSETPNLSSVSTEANFTQEKWKLNANIQRSELSLSNVIRKEVPTSIPTSIPTSNDVLMSQKCKLNMESDELCGPDEVCSSGEQSTSETAQYNENAWKVSLPLKLDKVCQAGLVYYNESGDGCCSITLKQPFASVRDNKVRTAVMKEAKDLFETFMRRLDILTKDCGKEILSELVNSKDFQNTQHIRTMLNDYGGLYRQTDRHNKQERLRLLSSVALYASNDQIRQYFRRLSNKGDVINVDEDEIKRARDYAKMFGPGRPLPSVNGETSLPSQQLSYPNNPNSKLTASGSVERKRTSVRKPIEVITIEDDPPPLGLDNDQQPKSHVVTKEQTHQGHVVTGLPGYFVTLQNKKINRSFDKLFDREKEQTLEWKKLPNHQETPVVCKNTGFYSLTTQIDAAEINRPMSPVYNVSPLLCNTGTNIPSAFGSNDELTSSFFSNVTCTTTTASSTPSLMSDLPIPLNGSPFIGHQLNEHYQTNWNSADDDSTSSRLVQDVKMSEEYLNEQDKVIVELKDENEASKRPMKRRRTIFSQEEKDKLEAFYIDSIFHGKTRKINEMQAVLNLDRRTIHTWFRNRRFREKKDAFGRKLKRASEIGKESKASELGRDKSETDESYEDSMASCSDEEIRLSETEKTDEEFKRFKSRDQDD